MGKTVNVEKLKERYVVKDVPPFGDCVIVPGEEFDPDWEVLLGIQGYVCSFGDLDGHPVTFVKLHRKGAEEKKPDCCKGPRWMREEEAHLLKRWGEVGGSTMPEKAELLAPEFAGRSETSLILKFNKLRRKKSKQEIPADGAVVFVEKGKVVEPKASAKDDFDVEAFEKSVARVISADLNKALMPHIELLQQAYDSLSTRYVELKTEFAKHFEFVLENMPLNGSELPQQVKALSEKLAYHKHAAGSGEAVIPLEA